MLLYFVLVGLISLSALFTALEIAFFSMEELDFLTAKHSKHKNAKRLLKLKQEKDNLLFGILICNNTTNISASALNVTLAFHLSQRYQLNPEWTAGIATIILTTAIIIFAEAIPKIVGLRIKFQMCLFFAPFLLGLNYLTYPFSKLVLMVVAILEKLKFSLHKTTPDVFQQAFIGLTEKSSKEGLIGQNESEVIRNVLALNRHVMTIMRPRNQVFALKSGSSIKDAMPIMTEQMLSRIPIFLDDLDNINGVVHIRDIFSSHIKEQHDKKLYQIAAKPIFVRDTWTIWNVLNILRRENSHLGIVVDEFGGMRGIITMEDILEELVGDILDEKDKKEEPDIKQIDDHKWEASGSMDMHSLRRKFETDFVPDGDFDTLQGFIMHKLKKIPATGDFIQHDNIWRFTVKQMTKNEIKVVEIIKESTPDIDESD